ncbi:siroheme synthase CysG [Microvirga tunisiensis]|uniref:Uroporphyrinogen-III C-methyltransferase n=1 Tax=Microvirga tunisiensis TaxID=2108360 RepID=A0A5N7MNG0_9HYPH|nr:siroheme synthase CysG [Microvirga tunisiensis]MPR10240.1 uroporphyrinogen-III C-methyltransferase [Microvirga tunisiensis]MPR28443.1 uroporphyrinogen-III C-methyltransferase [Microvirga tunisiensis]
MNASLRPEDRRPARLSALPKLPVFFDLAGRSILVVGGSDGIAWKVELLAAAGGTVRILAKDPSPELLALVQNDPERLTLSRRGWCGADLQGVSVAVADIDNQREAKLFADIARRRGALVNVVDQPAFCDFQFGSIVNRAPVIVSISTDGAAPILGQAIRRRIEAVLPSSLGAWAQAAKDFRDKLRDLVPTRQGRRRFWEQFVDAAFASRTHERSLTATLDQFAQEVCGEALERRALGEVVIVGAGPGNPELLTLKAMRELQAADVIVYDRLVTPAILELARREARRIHVGKEGHGASCRQEDINALIVDLALAGQRVVRLKGGDPAIFGRTGEEVAACREAGVSVRIVPGITTASAAAASLNVSLTHRDHAQRVQFITAHDRHGDLPENLNIGALADPQATTVVYMGRRTAAKLATRLIESGLPPDTPVVAISNVSRDDQQSSHTTIKNVAHGASLPESGPLIIAIGASVSAANESPIQQGSAFNALNEERQLVAENQQAVSALLDH